MCSFKAEPVVSHLAIQQGVSPVTTTLETQTLSASDSKELGS
jgi:hypothetical protein